MASRLLGAALALVPAVLPAQETATFGAWERLCAADGGCILSQVNRRPGTDDTVMRTDIAPLDGGGLLVAVRVPSAVRLDEGPWLTVEGVFVTALSFRNCAAGCVASATLPPGLAASLLSGGRAVVSLVALDGARIGIPVQLDGLRDGLGTVD